MNKGAGVVFLKLTHNPCLFPSTDLYLKGTQSRTGRVPNRLSPDGFK